MADVIGAVRVVLGADTAAFESGLKNAESGLARFAKNVSTIASGIALERALTKTIEAFVGSIKKAFVEAEKMGEMAQSFGIPVEELTKLKFAAELSGISVESLGTGMGRLSRNMVDAANGIGQARGAFQTLGITVTESDGTLKSASKIMEEVAGKFVKMEDGAGKTALAMQLFGRSGAALIPLLNEGAAGIKKMTDEAEAMGLVISKKTSDAAGRFNDNLEKMGKIWDGIVLRVVAEMATEFEKLSEALLDFARDPENIKRAAEIIVSGLQQLVSVALAIPIVFKNASESIRATFGLIQAVVSTNGQTVVEAWSEWKTVTDENADRWANLSATIKKFYDDLAGQEEERAKKPPPPTPIDAAKLEKEKQKALAILGQMDAEAKSIMDSVRAPWEQLLLEVDKVNKAFARGIITQEEFGRASAVVAQRVANNYAMAASSALNTFGDVFAQFGAKNKALFAASKAFSIASAIISAYVGANKALAEYPPPLSFVMAASVIAAGLANVAKISAQEPPKFATGGSFKVGGVGGIDSQRVMMDLSPGEMVDIRKGDSGGSGVQEIMLRTSRFRDILMNGDNFRDLVDTLNLKSPDGYKLRLAT